MDNKTFQTAYGDAFNYADPAAFASDWALSSALIDPDDTTATPSTDVYQQLIALWHVANDSFKDFLALIGLNQTGCAIRFCIPLRTVQNWAGGVNSCPPYLRMMMAEAIGIIKLRS